MNAISSKWRRLYVEMGEIDPKMPEKNPVVRKAMEPALYLRQSIEIHELFAPQSILEIGCGFGGLAREILSEDFTIDYTVVDNPQMLAQTKKILRQTVEYVEAPDYEKVKSLASREFDLLIANNCLTEVPREYAVFVLQRIAPVCKYLYLVDALGSLEAFLFARHFCMKEIHKERNPRRYKYLGVRGDEVKEVLLKKMRSYEEGNQND